jgi:c-di-GMP-binding flagellar brake protein YcgR
MCRSLLLLLTVRSFDQKRDQMKLKLPERRQFIRIEVPLKMTVEYSGKKDETLTKNISPVGLRFELGRSIKENEKLTLSLYLPGTNEPVLLEGRVVWQKRASREDNSPYDMGVEILSIEENNKNIFLKYLCDLLYGSVFKERS